MVIEFDGAATLDVVEGDGVEVVVANGVEQLRYRISFETE